jgi:hypothetical protein
MSVDNKHRQDRLKCWMHQSSRVLEQVPDDNYAYMEAAVVDLGKQNWEEQQSNLLKKQSVSKIPTEYHKFIRLGAAVIGAVTFSIAPTWLIRQTGRGVLADSMGLVGGGIAGYVVHDLAVQAIVGYSLKRRYLRNRKHLQKSMQSENHNG